MRLVLLTLYKIGNQRGMTIIQPMASLFLGREEKTGEKIPRHVVIFPRGTSRNFCWRGARRVRGFPEILSVF